MQPGLQYRFSALAGLATQFFWGIMMIFIYEAFYKNGVPSAMNWQELVSYIWLGQAFFALLFFRVTDTDIMESIRSGQVAYEFVKPLNLYWMWFSKIIAKRLSAGVLRFIPVIIVAVLLPQNYSLKGPISIEGLLLFIITMILGLIISTALAMIIHTFMFYTTTSKGLFNIYGNLADFFSGMIIPIAFMPIAIQTVCYIFPFRLCMDLPMRVYIGNISAVEGIQTVLVQIAWILALVLFGNYMMKKVSKKLIVQGG
ncbi:MAG: ABC-2 family transporter protein [Clostridia bacterium]|nr:ABC-2 family transporter protein [Clostridia bacterium]